MENDLKLQDIANELLIINETTLNRIFPLENCIDCLGLYIFYYKTAKWQQTNIIKATDLYTRQCLKLGKDRLKKAKISLQEIGLINIIQRKTTDGKINGWYIEVLYISPYMKKYDDNTTKDVFSKNSYFPQVGKPTSGKTETNALYNYNKCLNNNNYINNNKILEKKEKEKYIKEKESADFGNIDVNEEHFETFWKEYPKKVAKVNVKKWFTKNKPNEELFNKIMNGLRKFKNSEDWSKDNGKFIPYPSTWLNQERWEDEIQEQERIGHAIEGGWSL